MAYVVVVRGLLRCCAFTALTVLRENLTAFCPLARSASPPEDIFANVKLGKYLKAQNLFWFRCRQVLQGGLGLGS